MIWPDSKPPSPSLHAARFGRVLLIAVYAKNVQEDLTHEQKSKIRKAVQAFEESLEA
jgi:hypothetical protein